MTEADRAVRIYNLGVKAVIVFIAGALVSAFLPLEGPAAQQEAAAMWREESAGRYVAGWLNQTVMMLACSVIFSVAAWSIYAKAPVNAIVAWSLTLISTVIFMITKFFAVWTVPFAAEALATDGAGRESGELVLNLLNSSEAFGLVSSLDYLGFWLYSVIALALFRPLLQVSLSTTIAAVAFALYGFAVHLAFAAALADALAPQAFHLAVMSLGVLLLVAYGALLFHFRAQSAATFETAPA